MRYFLIIICILFNINNVNAQEEEYSEYSDDADFLKAYVIIIDTSPNYYKLREIMINLSDKIDVDIDTMERGYDESKDLICLPDDHEDEIYAGDYFPRRYPSETLSLEYLIIYDGNATNRTIGLVAGIFEDETDAMHLLNKVKKYRKHAYLLETELFIGCMH